MKYEMMLAILFELLSKKSVNAKYLAEKYEISIRSVYRYINALECAGVPLYTIRGNKGGFAIIDTYKLPSSFLTKNEYEQTISALTAIEGTLSDKYLKSAINKLKSSAKNSYSDFDIKSGNLIIDAGPWGDTVGYKTKLVAIQKSINENTLLSITYHDRNGTITTRKIEPHVIVFKQGIWYVFAYCRLREQFRFFKLGRIESANAESETFTRRDISKEDLPLDFWNNMITTETVELKIDKKIVSDIEEWLGVENVYVENGEYYAKANLPFDDGLVSKIMSYGNGIKVISPALLQTKIKETAIKLTELY